MAFNVTMSSTNKYLKYCISYYLNSQDLIQNTSNVTIKFWMWRTNTGYQTSANGNLWMTVDGTEYTSSGHYTISDPTGIVAYERTLDIPHNSDGTKTLNVSGGFNMPGISTHSDPSTQYDSYVLPTIARGSTIASITDITVDDSTAPTVTWTAASSTFSHVLKFSVGSYASSDISIPSGQTSYSYSSFDIPLSWMNASPNSSTFNINVSLKTYNGSTLIGENVKTFVATCGSAANPTSSISYQKTGQTTIAGYLSGGKNGLSISASYTLQYGATIGSVAFYDGVDIIPNSTQTTCSISMLSAGSHTIKAVVTDSRGLTSESSFSITVYAYANPNANNTVAYRVASSGSTTRNDSGTYCYVKPVFTYSDCGGLNSLSVKNIEYRSTTSQSWTTAASSVTSGNDYWISNVDYELDYQVRMVLTDLFETVYSSPILVPGAMKLMSFNGALGGVAIGQKADVAGFVSNMTMRFKKEVIYDIPSKTNQDANSLQDTGLWYISSGGSNLPTGYSSGWIFVEYSATGVFQVFTAIDGKIFTRVKTSSWSSWCSIENNISDYIVEQGTSGIWTYRKWNSGIAECWGYYRYDTPSGGIPSGTAIQEQVTLPNIFVSRIPAQITNNHNAWRMGPPYDNIEFSESDYLQKVKLTVYLEADASYGSYHSWSVFVQGTWK